VQLQGSSMGAPTSRSSSGDYKTLARANVQALVDQVAAAHKGPAGHGCTDLCFLKGMQAGQPMASIVDVPHIQLGEFCSAQHAAHRLCMRLAPC
jgi:hypothetical protein